MKNWNIKFGIIMSIVGLMMSGCCQICCQVCDCNDGPLTPTMEGSAQGEYAFLWLAADKDAWVGCTTKNCADGDHNHGTLFSLDVANINDPAIPPGQKRIYVEFYMPKLPEGTEIVEAHINLYEDSRQMPDHATRPVIEVTKEWDPRTINHNNQPMTLGSLTEDAKLGVFRDVNQWRGTLPGNNLLKIVRKHHDSPGQNHGFLVNNDPVNVRFLRSFRSDNARSRTETEMDFSPRLLLKVKFREGEGYLDDTNVILPPLPDDTDLDEFLAGPDVLMLRIEGGNTWPASWNVAFN